MNGGHDVIYLVLRIGITGALIGGLFAFPLTKFRGKVKNR